MADAKFNYDMNQYTEENTPVLVQFQYGEIFHNHPTDEVDIEWFNTEEGVFVWADDATIGGGPGIVITNGGLGYESFDEKSGIYYRYKNSYNEHCMRVVDGSNKDIDLSRYCRMKRFLQSHIKTHSERNSSPWFTRALEKIKQRYIEFENQEDPNAGSYDKFDSDLIQDPRHLAIIQKIKDNEEALRKEREQSKVNAAFAAKLKALRKKNMEYDKQIVYLKAVLAKAEEKNKKVAADVV